MPRGRRSKIEVPTESQPHFELGHIAEDTERRRRERDGRKERERQEKEEKERERLERERKRKNRTGLEQTQILM